MAHDDVHALDGSSGHDVSLLKRRVTDVAGSDGGWLPAAHPGEYENEDDVPWFVYVWPSSNGLPLDELRLYLGEDVEHRFDDTGLVWPPEARRKLYSQLPKSERESPTIRVGGDLPTIRDRAVEALTAANNPPVFFRCGGVFKPDTPPEDIVRAPLPVDPATNPATRTTVHERRRGGPHPRPSERRVNRPGAQVAPAAASLR